MDKIDEFAAELKDPATPVPERLLALKFVLHYAIAVERVRGGYKVVARVEYRSRAEADKGSLQLMAHHEDTAAITLERELVSGEMLDAAALKR